MQFPIAKPVHMTEYISGLLPFSNGEKDNFLSGHG